MAGPAFLTSFEHEYQPEEADLHDYASFIGIDVERESALMWIAIEGIKAPIPEPFRACKSENGDIYYYNEKTGKVSWDHPLDNHYRRLVRQEREKLASKQAARPPRPSSSLMMTMDAGPLPPMEQSQSDTDENPPLDLSSRLTPLKALDTELDIDSVVEQAVAEASKKYELRIQILRSNIQDKDQIIDNQISQVQDLYCRIEELESTQLTESHEHEKQSLRQQIIDQQTRLDEQETHILNIETELKQLKAARADELSATEARVAAETSAKVDHDIESMRGMLQEKQIRITELEREIGRMQSETQNQIDAAVAKTMTQVSTKHQQELHSAESLLQKREDQLQQLEAELEQLKQEHAKALVAASKQAEEDSTDQLEQQLELAQGMLQERQARIEHLEQDIARIQSGTQSEIDAAVAKTLTEQSKKHQQELQAVQSLVQEQEDRQRQLETDISEMKAKKAPEIGAAVEQALAELSEMHKLEIQKMQQELQERKTQLEQAEMELQLSKSSHISQIDNFEDSLATLKSSVHSLEQSLQERQIEIEARDAQIARLKAQNIIDIDTAVDEALKKITSLHQRELAALQKRMDQKSLELQQLKMSFEIQDRKDQEEPEYTPEQSTTPLPPSIPKHVAPTTKPHTPTPQQNARLKQIVGDIRSEAIRLRKAQEALAIEEETARRARKQYEDEKAVYLDDLAASRRRTSLAGSDKNKDPLVAERKRLVRRHRVLLERAKELHNTERVLKYNRKWIHDRHQQLYALADLFEQRVSGFDYVTMLKSQRETIRGFLESAQGDDPFVDPISSALPYSIHEEPTILEQQPSQRKRVDTDKKQREQQNTLREWERIQEKSSEKLAQHAAFLRNLSYEIGIENPRSMWG